MHVDMSLNLSLKLSPLYSFQIDNNLPNMPLILLYSILATDGTVSTGARPLDILVPKLLELLSNAQSDTSLKLKALVSYNCLLYLLENPLSIAIGGLRSRNTSFDSDGGKLNKTPPMLSPSNSNQVRSLHLCPSLGCYLCCDLRCYLCCYL